MIEAICKKISETFYFKPLSSNINPMNNILSYEIMQSAINQSEDYFSEIIVGKKKKLLADIITCDNQCHQYTKVFY